MTDTITTIGRSIVQHGPFNNRVYLMTPCPEEVPWVIEKIDDLATTKGYSKILARVPESMEGAFLEAQYVREAAITEYFASGEKLLFMSRFFQTGRDREYHPARVKRNFTLVANDSEPSLLQAADLPAIRLCDPSDCVEIAHIFRRVFASYPFPVDDPEYLAETMASHTRYLCATVNRRIVGLCAGEMDRAHLAAEMTDFAVLSEMRGKGMAAYLLARLEQEMIAAGMRTAFTISRTLSAGMNIVFKRANYIWGGTLVNNTQISGGIESMWVWHKRLTGW